MGDAIESEEKIVWSNGMIAIADKHNLKTIEVPNKLFKKLKSLIKIENWENIKRSVEF